MGTTRQTTLIVDEAGMVGTSNLHRLIELAERQHWRPALVGDPRQLQAVGRGGMFTELCATGRTIELEHIHRFTQPWEAAASSRCLLQVSGGCADETVVSCSLVADREGVDFTMLFASAQAGEGWAWRYLFTSLSPAVAGYFRVQGARDVDDLVSEVFAALFRQIGSFEGSEQQFRSWVFVIAHHRLIDERRRHARSLVDACRDTPEPATSKLADAEWICLERLSLERVVAVCGQVAVDQRDVLLLRMVDDLTIEQIASVVGKSLGAVKALQRRGLAALHRILTAEAHQYEHVR